MIEIIMHFITTTFFPAAEDIYIITPIDLVASRYGVFCQGCDEVALTLLDVLDCLLYTSGQPVHGAAHVPSGRIHLPVLLGTRGLGAEHQRRYPQLL